MSNVLSRTLARHLVFNYFFFPKVTTLENDVFNVFGVTVTKDRLLQYSFCTNLFLDEKAVFLLLLLKGQ